MNILNKILGALTAKQQLIDDENYLIAKSHADNRYPFYIKAPLVLIGLIALFYILYIFGDILVPIGFSLMLAILLNPFYNKLVSFRTPKILAITIVIISSAIVVTVLMVFIASQLNNFTEMLPALKVKFNAMYVDIQYSIKRLFKIPLYKQEEFIKKALSNGQEYITATVSSMFNLLSFIVLIPIYVFLLLYYKPLLLNFIYECFDDKDGDQVEEILTETKGAVQSYVVGLMIEMVIVAILNSVALLILDVDYAILIGILGAILNLVPYLGGIVAIVIPVVIASVTKDGYVTQLLILAAYTIIQFIDNNIIMPKVVSSKVSVNALISLVIVLLGNMLWGVGGMFLSIPFVAVLKIIFDRVEDLKPWGKLLGVKLPAEDSRIQARLRRVTINNSEATTEIIIEDN